MVRSVEAPAVPPDPWTDPEAVRTEVVRTPVLRTGREGMVIGRPCRSDSMPRAAIGAALMTVCFGVRVRVGVA